MAHIFRPMSLVPESALFSHFRQTSTHTHSGLFLFLHDTHTSIHVCVCVGKKRRKKNVKIIRGEKKGNAHTQRGKVGVAFPYGHSNALGGPRKAEGFFFLWNSTLFPLFFSVEMKHTSCFSRCPVMDCIECFLFFSFLNW
jgi:hypothetical protein